MLGASHQARARPPSSSSSGHASTSSRTDVRRPALRVAVVAGACSTSGSGSSGSGSDGGRAATATQKRRGAGVARRPAAPSPSVACRAIEEKRETAETTEAPETLLSDAARVAAMRRADGAPEPSAPNSAGGGGGENMLQGAASEARLITWPRPQKALLDTALVLAIVAGTSALVFGLNVVLAETATAWYKGH